MFIEAPAKAASFRYFCSVKVACLDVFKTTIWCANKWLYMKINCEFRTKIEITNNLRIKLNFNPLWSKEPNDHLKQNLWKPLKPFYFFDSILVV